LKGGRREVRRPSAQWSEIDVIKKLLKKYIMKEILDRLFEHQKLTKDGAKSILKRISSREFSNAQIMAFMAVYQMRSITVEELMGFREALLDLCIKVDFSEFDTIDMCGTGGDGKNTFNISTVASFIVAGAGYKVAKHGNYGVSSISGSSNVLEQMGYDFTADENVLKDQIRDANITFLHAPKFHPAMAAVGPIRKELGMKTFFNMLGPIVNPSRPNSQLAGVFSLELARLYQYIFQAESNKKYAIIYGVDGFDEISLTDDFIIRDNNGQHLLSPDALGLDKINLNEIQGGKTIEESANIFKTILKGNGTEVQNNVVCANAAMAIKVMTNNDFNKCFNEAKESLLGGNALKSLNMITK